ncbi:MAG: cytochrome c maturation protein CcmE [Eggerthellaceae bacterium]|nr:cytochrome c maturation protein CcmE [Eggerthellaceae bacterium]
MNARMKKRLVIVTGLIVIVIAVVLAVVGGNSSAKTVTIAQASSGDYLNKRVQVTGNVVENSYSTEGDVLTFAIHDPDDDAAPQLTVVYDGSVSATFGNDVTAICTGKMAEDGVLHCSELVTKCPSKYESGADALQVSQMLGYGDDVLDKTVRVTGVVKAGSQSAAGQGDRFVLVDAEDGTTEVAVTCGDAVSEEAIADGATVVLTGHMCDNGKFDATNVALEG